MNRPHNSNVIKELLMNNGMSNKQWTEIESHIENTRLIHHSILFFIMDPYDVLLLIPQSWIDMFPNGFLDCLEQLNKKLDENQRIDLFRRAMYFDIEYGLCQILKRDIHIDDFLTYIPDIFLDKILSNSLIVDKIIEQCKMNKQDDSIGYTKLLLLK